MGIKAYMNKLEVFFINLVDKKINFSQQYADDYIRYRKVRKYLAILMVINLALVYFQPAYVLLSFLPMYWFYAIFITLGVKYGTLFKGYKFSKERELMWSIGKQNVFKRLIVFLPIIWLISFGVVTYLLISHNY